MMIMEGYSTARNTVPSTFSTDADRVAVVPHLRNENAERQLSRSRTRGGLLSLQGGQSVGQASEKEEKEEV